MAFYKSLISDELVDLILTSYRQVENSLQYNRASLLFPTRKYFNDLPLYLTERLIQELITICKDDFHTFIPNTSNIRIYQSNYGTVKSHKDVAIDQRDTHTCLIYLTEDFHGGNLFLDMPLCKEISDMEEQQYSVEMITPHIGYGIIFDKNTTHYNNELLFGDKIILLLDIQIE